MIKKKIQLDFKNKQIKDDYKKLIDSKLSIRSRIDFTQWKRSALGSCSCNGD